MLASDTLYIKKRELYFPFIPNGQLFKRQRISIDKKLCDITQYLRKSFKSQSRLYLVSSSDDSYSCEDKMLKENTILNNKASETIQSLFKDANYSQISTQTTTPIGFNTNHNSSFYSANTEQTKNNLFLNHCLSQDLSSQYTENSTSGTIHHSNMNKADYHTFGINKSDDHTTLNDLRQNFVPKCNLLLRPSQIVTTANNQKINYFQNFKSRTDIDEKLYGPTLLTTNTTKDFASYNNPIAGLSKQQQIVLNRSCSTNESEKIYANEKVASDDVTLNLYTQSKASTNLFKTDICNEKLNIYDEKQAHFPIMPHLLNSTQDINRKITLKEHSQNKINFENTYEQMCSENSTENVKSNILNIKAKENQKEYITSQILNISDLSVKNKPLGITNCSKKSGKILVEENSIIETKPKQQDRMDKYRNDIKTKRINSRYMDLNKKPSQPDSVNVAPDRILEKENSVTGTTNFDKKKVNKKDLSTAWKKKLINKMDGNLRLKMTTKTEQVKEGNIEVTTVNKYVPLGLETTNYINKIYHVCENKSKYENELQSKSDYSFNEIGQSRLRDKLSNQTVNSISLKKKVINSYRLNFSNNCPNQIHNKTQTKSYVSHKSPDKETMKSKSFNKSNVVRTNEGLHQTERLKQIEESNQAEGMNQTIDKKNILDKQNRSEQSNLNISDRSTKVSTGTFNLMSNSQSTTDYYTKNTITSNSNIISSSIHFDNDLYIGQNKEPEKYLNSEIKHNTNENTIDSTAKKIETTERKEASSWHLPTSLTSETVLLNKFIISEDEDGCIITPGQHRICINNFLMENDLHMKNNLITRYEVGAASISNYAQDIYLKWRSMESLVDNDIHQLSFKPNTDIEKFRRASIYFILQHVHEWGLHNSIAHISVLNIHRMLLHYIRPKNLLLTTNMFINTVFACLRMAIKHEETPEKIRPMRRISKSMCKLLGLEKFICKDPTLKLTNETTNIAEQECLKTLSEPLIIASAPDFLDRYLCIGRWPSNLSKMYHELALYLLNLSLFSRKDIDQLNGIPPSILAGAALSLSIRVISAGREDGYECWPERLTIYTGYSLTDLKPAVRGLSALLRRKPEGSEILEKFHPLWASFDWK